VDLMAPGDGVYTTDADSNSDYASVSGTSFSCPLAAGLCTLIFSANGALSPDDVETILKDSCDDLGSSGVDNTYGYGRIEVFEAMNMTGGGATADFSYYNGSGYNPFIFTSTNLPILGSNWVTEVDGGSVGASGLTFAVAYSAPFGFMTGIGELLVDVSSPWLLTHISGGGSGISTHTILLPNDPFLAGIHAYTQALLNNVGGVAKLTNAIDATLGY